MGYKSKLLANFEFIHHLLFFLQLIASIISLILGSFYLNKANVIIVVAIQTMWLTFFLFYYGSAYMGICVLNFKNGTKGLLIPMHITFTIPLLYIVVIELFYWNNKFVNEIIPTTSTNLINYLHFLSIVKICSFIQLGCQIVQALLAIYSN